MLLETKNAALIKNTPAAMSIVSIQILFFKKY